MARWHAARRHDLAYMSNQSLEGVAVPSGTLTLASYVMLRPSDVLSGGVVC